MNNFLNLIDRYKFGILAVFILYISIFIYLQISSFEKSYFIDRWFSEDMIDKNEVMIELKPENLEILTNTTSSVKNITRNQNDKREKSTKEWSETKPYTQSVKEVPRSDKEIERSIKELEKQFFSETGGDERRKKIIEEKNIKLAQKNENRTNTKNIATKTGGDKVFGGNVMVDWVLTSRDPHQNDPYFVRNPGYTCGDHITGLVTIKIKVDQSGRVIDAKFLAGSSKSVSPCMIEQARKYALMSRFNYSNTAPTQQDGMIRYTFVSQ
jgi:hypothetical protein